MVDGCEANGDAETVKHSLPKYKVKTAQLSRQGGASEGQGRTTPTAVRVPIQVLETRLQAVGQDEVKSLKLLAKKRARN